MPFRVVYNYKPRTFDDNGKYVDNDTYTIFAEDCKVTKNNDGKLDIYSKTISLTVTYDELDQLYDEMKKAIWERNDTRGYHE
jgi:hypothetical protein